MISFSAPWALAGLVLAAVPLLLHLVARREPPTVVFPAVRYLEEASRRHQRRLHLQHWLLLLVRTLLVAALVLAAAGPTRAGGAGPGGHAPAALVLVVDNSLSSGAVRDGRRTLDDLLEAARRLLDRATDADRLWLIAADGVPRAGSRSALRELLDSLGTTSRRLDLGLALHTAQAVLAAAERAGEVVLLTDGQRSALGAAQGRAPVLVGIPSGAPPVNTGLASLDAGPQPWLGPGRVVLATTGDSAAARPVAVGFAGREPRPALVAGGQPVAVPLQAPPAGWHALAARLDPDELRGDDVAVAAVRVSTPAVVTWDPADRFVAAAAEVLAANGRLVAGAGLTLGALGPGRSVVVPPSDPAALGALNRALAARGIPWTFGELVTVPTRVDSGGIAGPAAVARRHRLVPSASGMTGVLATAGGEPWIVRSGEIVLLGSRLDPAWTELPALAGYMPFMDALVNRHARGESPHLGAAPGDEVALPAGVSEVAGPDGTRSVESGGRLVPTSTGLHWLLQAGDTVGVLAVNPDPRESRLEPATPGEVTALWPGAIVGDPDEAVDRAFGQGAQADLRGPLLWLAALLGLVELLLGGALRRGEA